MILCWLLEFIYCSFVVSVSYNPLERRETSKGGKEVSKRSAQSQQSSKGTTTAPKAQSNHNPRRNETNPVVLNSANQSGKSSRPSSREGIEYDKQVVS